MWKENAHITEGSTLAKPEKSFHTKQFGKVGFKLVNCLSVEHTFRAVNTTGKERDKKQKTPTLFDFSHCMSESLVSSASGMGLDGR